jgi:hypothetical protein
MRDLSKREQEEAMTCAAWLYTERRKGTCSEEEIAHSLKFQSVEHMYRQLKGWGFPDWLVYPTPPKPRENQEVVGAKEIYCHLEIGHKSYSGRWWPPYSTA